MATMWLTLRVPAACAARDPPERNVRSSLDNQPAARSIVTREAPDTDRYCASLCVGRPRSLLSSENGSLRNS